MGLHGSSEYDHISKSSTARYYTYFIYTSQIASAEKTSYFSTASVNASKTSKDNPSRLGGRLGYKNSKSSSRTSAVSDKSITSAQDLNSGGGNPDDFHAMYLRSM